MSSRLFWPSYVFFLRFANPSAPPLNLRLDLYIGHLYRFDNFCDSRDTNLAHLPKQVNQKWYTWHTLTWHTQASALKSHGLAQKASKHLNFRCASYCGKLCMMSGATLPHFRGRTPPIKEVRAPPAPIEFVEGVECPLPL